MMGAGAGAAATQRPDAIGQVANVVAGTAVKGLETANSINQDLKITDTAQKVAVAGF